MANTFNVTLVTTNFTATIAAPPSPTTIGIGTYTVKINPSPQVVVTATNTYQNIEIVDNGIINILSPSAGTVDEFNGDGVTTTFRLTKALPTSGDFLEVIVGGVVQTPGLSYTTSTVNTIYTSTTDILFTQAPPSGTKNVVARYYSILVAEQIEGPQGVQGIQGTQGPSQGSQGTMGTQGATGTQGAGGGITQIVNGGGLVMSPASGLGVVTLTNKLGTAGTSKQINIVGTLTNLASSQAANTIILNATNSVINGVSGQTSSTYVAPVRYVTGGGAPANFLASFAYGFTPDTGNFTLSSNVGSVYITYDQSHYNCPNAVFDRGDGIPEYLAYASNDLNIASTSSWAYDAWFRPTNDDNNRILLSFNNNGNYLELQYDNNRGFGIFVNNSFTQGYGDGGIGVGGWSHFFFQYDNGRFYFGINGYVILGPQQSYTLTSPMYIGGSTRYPTSALGYLNLPRFYNSAVWPRSGNYTVPLATSYTGAGNVIPQGFYHMAYNPTTSEIIYWS
jgi:hypothetical protein